MCPDGCEFPWMGALQECIVCGQWWIVVTFRDSETGESWKAWSPISLSGQDLVESGTIEHEQA